MRVKSRSRLSTVPPPSSDSVLMPRARALPDYTGGDGGVSYSDNNTLDTHTHKQWEFRHSRVVGRSRGCAS